MSSCRGRIIGFIGTVQGLSTAVGSLNMGDTADPEALKASLNSLTGGLGVAFDTTLLGLVLSMILSFPLAAVQKKEDEMLTLVDVFCTEKLLPKLNDTGTSRRRDGLLEQAESLPAMVDVLAQAHAGSVRVGCVTGTQHINVRPNLRRAYEDHTHLTWFLSWLLLVVVLRDLRILRA